MQRLDLSISGLPTDVLKIILSVFPEYQFLNNLRLVSKKFKDAIDQILTEPLNVIKIISLLDDNQALVFQSYYKTTQTYKTLLEKNNKDMPLDGLEKVCLEWGQQEKEDLVKKAFKRCMFLSVREKIKLLNQLPLQGMRYFLKIILQYNHLTRDYYPLSALNEILTRYRNNPEQKKQDPFLFECVLFNVICFALATPDIHQIDLQKLSFACNTLLQEFEYQSNQDFQLILAGLAITILFRKKDKTEEDWKKIRNDANKFTNLSGIDLLMDNAKLVGAKFSGVNFFQATFSRTDLSWADLSFANLTEAKLFNTNLTSTNLSYANLKRSTWSGTIINYTNFTGCNFLNSDLQLVNFYNANFNLVRMYEIDLNWYCQQTKDLQLINPCLYEALWFRNRNSNSNSNSKNPKFLDDFKLELKQIGWKSNGYENDQLIYSSIARDLLRILPGNNKRLALDMLDYALQESPLFDVRIVGLTIFARPAITLANIEARKMLTDHLNLLLQPVPLVAQPSSEVRFRR